MTETDSDTPKQQEPGGSDELNKIVHTGTISLVLGLSGLFGIGSCLGIYFGFKTIRMVHMAKNPVEGFHRWMGHAGIASGIASFGYWIAFLFGFRMSDFLTSVGFPV